MDNLADKLIVAGFIVFFIVLFRVSVPWKMKRMVRRCERVRDRMTDAEVKRYISFLRTHTMIKTPDIAWELIQTQRAINASKDIDDQYKLLLFKTLMKRNIQGLQQINTVFVDKTGKRI
jgi:hypothetical protein